MISGIESSGNSKFRMERKWLIIRILLFERFKILFNAILTINILSFRYILECMERKVAVYEKQELPNLARSMQRYCGSKCS
jgi:hypothetical protein